MWWRISGLVKKFNSYFGILGALSTGALPLSFSLSLPLSLPSWSCPWFWQGFYDWCTASKTLILHLNICRPISYMLCCFCLYVRCAFNTFCGSRHLGVPWRPDRTAPSSQGCGRNALIWGLCRGLWCREARLDLRLSSLPAPQDATFTLCAYIV